MEEKILGTLASGESVIDRPKSHRHATLTEEVLATALSKVTSKQLSFVEATVTVEEGGFSNCVETTAADEIVFARRPGRQGYTRFVKGKTPEPTNQVAVILLRGTGRYVLLTAYWGIAGNKEPWDKNAQEKDRQYWKNHAIVLGSEPIDEPTLTTETPPEFLT